MLCNTFQHISGIGDKSELQLWNSGIQCWDDFVAPNTQKFSEVKIRTINTRLDESRQNLTVSSRNPGYFYKALPARLHWRLFPDFRESAVYLDIETTGLDRDRDQITTIALYDGNKTFWYVNGENLDDFRRDIFKYKLIISYNGKSFDVPVIENFFGIKIPHAHIDLRHILNSLGYRGGLKKCEIAMGIDRGSLADIDGYFAVLLWDEYRKQNSPKILETLLAYNIEDVLNLETLMIMAFNMKLSDTPFKEEQAIALPDVPAVNPFSPDQKVVDSIKKRYYHFY